MRKAAWLRRRPSLPHFGGVRIDELSDDDLDEVTE